MSIDSRSSVGVQVGVTGPTEIEIPPNHGAHNYCCESCQAERSAVQTLRRARSVPARAAGRPALLALQISEQRAGQIFRYAIATGRAERDSTGDLRGALTPLKVKSRAALTDPKRVGELLRAIDGYSGQLSTEYALKLAPLVFVRPGELRAARWDEFEIDGERPEWRIPGERMKMGELHIVPLAHQAITLLRQLKEQAGDGGYLFPSLRTAARPISENTLGAALRRLGFSKDDMTAHGFRAMASTLLNEQGFPPDVIELQLTHAERYEVRAVYYRAQRLEERRRMMQAWADYLDGLRAGGNVIAIKRRATAR